MKSYILIDRSKNIRKNCAITSCFTSSDEIDEKAIKLWIDTAEGLKILFPTAFDTIPKSNKFEAIYIGELYTE